MKVQIKKLQITRTKSKKNILQKRKSKISYITAK